MHAKSCKLHRDGGVKVALGGRFGRSQRGANRNGGVKVALGGRFAALC